MKAASRMLKEYNTIFKENEKVYRDAVRLVGLPDTAFWILYALRDANGPLTQRDIININFLPPQTVNSALKKLQTEGYVVLRGTDDRRRKQVCLTAQGEALARRTADRVMQMEEAAAAGLTAEEQAEFLRLFQKYTDLLKHNLTELQGGTYDEQL